MGTVELIMKQKSHVKKAKGAFIRSRQTWLEEGEREKQPYKCSCLNTLVIDGTLTQEPGQIAEFCKKFYEKVYNSSFQTTHLYSKNRYR